MRKHPFILAILIAVGISALSLVIYSFKFTSKEHNLLVVGTSAVGNYRLQEGDRLQDQLRLRLNPHWAVENFAEPGACLGDLWLQVQKAKFLGYQVSHVLITIDPQHLLGGGCGEKRHFDESGANLKWLPLNSAGYHFFQELEPKERNIAVVQKLGLMFGVFDVFRDVWLEEIQWPHERKRMLTANPVTRNQAILNKAKVEGQGWEKDIQIGDFKFFDTLYEVQQMKRILQNLATQGIQYKVVILPQAHTGIYEQAFSAVAQAKMKQSYQYTIQWMQQQNISYIDLNAGDQKQLFPPSDWDDLWHLKSPRSFQFIAQTIADSLKNNWLSQP